MRLRALMGPVAAFGLLFGTAAVADDAQQETTDMPASKHQEQVIKGKTESQAPTRAQGDIVDDMPATKHQKEVLEEVNPAAGPDSDQTPKNQQDQQSDQ